VIFVTVGLHPQGFDRLLKKMDVIANQLDESVIMQIGSSSYHPTHAEWFEYAKNTLEFESYIKKARVVVCHGGAGTIITALRFKKPVIALPRLQKYNEHTDDHQVQIVDQFYKMGLINKGLSIDNIYNLNFDDTNKKLTNFRKKLIDHIFNYLDHLENNY